MKTKTFPERQYNESLLISSDALISLRLFALKALEEMEANPKQEGTE